LNISPAAKRLCSILSFDQQNKSELESIEPGDWESILDLARHQNLAPLLYHRIRNLGLCDTVPDEVLIILRNQYLRSAARGMRIIRQFDDILAGLDTAHLPVIPLKGIYLVQVVYQNPALHPMGDIDILIKTQDSSEAVEIIRSMGYQPIRRYSLRSEYKFHRHLPSFVKQGAVPVEVHNALQDPADPFNIDPVALWNRSRETYQADHVMDSLDPCDMILYLCINVAFHDLFHLGLIGLYDLGTVIAHYQTILDWDELYKRSLAWRTNHLVYITLSLARNLLGANVPSEFLLRLAPSHFDEEIFSICTDFIFARPSEADLPITPDLDRLVRIGNPMAKFRILLNRLFIPRAEITYYYNVPPGSWKIFWCYPQRFKYLIERYFLVGLRLHRGDHQLMALSEEVRIQEHQRRILIENLV
jgi:hypothetical protein